MYRIDKLIKADRKLFHTQDLAILWNIQNKNTLYTTVKRYLKKGILFQIHKGFYATIPADKIDPYLLGSGYLHRYTYLSCEYILAREGIIFQSTPLFTLVSSISKKFTIGINAYYSRQMKNEYLFNDLGKNYENGRLSAKPERALADLLYFNPEYYTDNKKINWPEVKKIQKEVFGK